MPSSSTSSTSSSVASTNPTLTSLFTSLFSGGIGAAAGGTLGSIMSGQQLQTNTSQLYSTLQRASQPQYQQGLAQVNEQMARAGLSNSTSASGAIGGYTNQYLANLTNLSTQMGLQEEGVQSSVAGNLMSMLATAGSQYYTNKSTTTTSMPWTQGFSSIMGGAMDIGSMFGGGGALEGLNPWG